MNDFSGMMASGAATSTKNFFVCNASADTQNVSCGSNRCEFFNVSAPTNCLSSQNPSSHATIPAGACRVGYTGSFQNLGMTANGSPIPTSPYQNSAGTPVIMLGSKSSSSGLLPPICVGGNNTPPSPAAPPSHHGHPNAPRPVGVAFF